MTIPFNDLGRLDAALQAELEAAALRVLRSGWFVLGPEVRAFEEQWAAWCGARHCIGLASGTDALELALRAAGVGPDDEVLTAANAGGYTACAARALGAHPTYADVDPQRLTLDPQALAAAITPRTRAIVAVHLYGQTADLAGLLEVAAAHQIPLLEDCAQAHGAMWQGQQVGALGLAGCFSFYPTKNLGALGDGGALITSDDAFAARVRELRTYGWSSKYTITRPGGSNSRLDELQAALLQVKLRHLATQNMRRRAIAERYAAGLADLAVQLPLDTGAGHVHHLYVVQVPAARRDALRAQLAAQQIGTDVHYPIPDHQQPAWAAEYLGLVLPVTEEQARCALSLPCYPELTDAEVEAVIAAFHSA